MLLAGGPELASQAGQARTPPAPPADSSHYHPAFHPPPAIEAIERFLPAGSDGFPEEKTAEALAGELNRLGAAIRERPGSIGAAAGTLLGPQFRGGHFVAGFRTVEVAEFLITRIETEPAGAARTTVRFDLSGTAMAGGRTERIGHWQMRWKEDAGHWTVAEWTALDSVTSRSAAPVFSDATSQAFGRIPAFTTQLTPNLDDWIARLDSTFMPGGRSTTTSPN